MDKLYQATDFIVNYCCSSCGEYIMDTNNVLHNMNSINQLVQWNTQTPAAMQKV